LLANLRHKLSISTFYLTKDVTNVNHAINSVTDSGMPLIFKRNQSLVFFFLEKRVDDGNQSVAR